MRYLALIYREEVDAGSVSPERWAETTRAYVAFGSKARAAGVKLTGDALQPTSTATTVRVRDGRRFTTDGPFAETREALGGFYLMECDDLDQAIDWAAQIPGALEGCVEVRPVIDFNPEDLSAVM